MQSAPVYRTVIYKYGLLPPSENRDLFDQQMKLGAEYSNALREVERRSRERYRAIIDPLRPDDLKAEVERLEVALDSVREEIKAERAKTRGKRGPKNPELEEKKAVATALAEQLRQARDKLKAADDKIRAMKEVAKAAREAAKGADAPVASFVAGDDEVARAARALLSSEEEFSKDFTMARTAARARGLYVGTYQVVEQSFKAARMKLDVDRPRRYDGTGRVGVYMTSSVKVEDVLLGACNYLRIDGDRVKAWRGGRRVKTSLRIRVQSKDRDPVWTTFEMCYHRPLPPGSTFQFAWVQRYKIAFRDKYELMVVLKIPESASMFCPHGDGSGGRVAVDLGWRARDLSRPAPADGIRVAVWVGDDGATGEIRLGQNIVSQLDKADSLRAIRDRAYDEVRAELRKWLGDSVSVVPEWMEPLVNGLPQWKSPKKMVRLLRLWCGSAFEDAVRAANKYSGDPAKLTQILTQSRENCIEGDAWILAGLLEWVAQDRHLWTWEANSRANAIGTRDKEYRTIANQLAARYSTLILEDFDLRTFARLPKPEAGSAGQGRQQRSARTDAAPSELRGALEWSFERVRREVRRIDPARTTLDHYVCGKPFAPVPAPAEQVRLFCSTCSVWVDQDENAAHALLARDRGPAGVPGAPVEERAA